VRLKDETLKSEQWKAAREKAEQWIFLVVPAHEVELAQAVILSLLPPEANL
jgi:hypothetical protein